MSIQSEITRISNNVQNTIDVIEQTGVSIPAGANSDNLPSLAQALANEKQDKLTGTQGQVVGFDEDGNAVPQAAGVTSFNGRTGAVTPQTGDYTADMVGARPNTWTPTASDVGAVPTTRTINSKPLSSNVTLTAEDVGAGEPANSATVTLTAAGWTGSAAPFSQQVSCSIVAADTAVVAVDVDTPGTDADADAEAINAWALCTQQNPTQGAGTLTFYCTEKPTINIPVKVGVA